MNENDDLRQLFEEATADIRPQGTFEEIRTRTQKVDPMTRAWFLPAIAAATVVALAVGGAFYLTRDNPTKPSTSTGPASQGATTGSAVVTVKPETVYYVGDAPAGPRLFTEQVTVTAPSGSVSAFAMEAAKAAVSAKPKDPDYRSPWPAGTVIQGLGGCEDSCDIQVTFDGTSVRDRPAGMTDQLARLAIDQLVRTAQAAMGNHNPVFFASYTSADGTQRLDQVLGVDTHGSIGPLGDDTVLAPVQVTSPANGEQVPPGDLTVTGLASTFEANVVWELLVGGDAVVRSGHTTAAECCTLSPYSFTIKGLQPGTYTLVVHDTDESGAGRPVNQDSKEIIVG